MRVAQSVPEVNPGPVLVQPSRPGELPAAVRAVGRARLERLQLRLQTGGGEARASYPIFIHGLEIYRCGPCGWVVSRSVSELSLVFA